MAQDVQQARTNPVQAFAQELRLPAYLKEFDQLMPEGVDSGRFVRSVVTAVTANPDLLKADRKSLFFAIRKAAQLGLDCSGVQGEGWLVVLKGKVEYWVGYKGKMKQARQSGEIAGFECEIIYENDHVVYRKGIETVFEITPDWNNPGEPVGVYAIARFRDGTHLLKVMGQGQLAAKEQKIGRSFGPWKTDKPAMWQKTVIHDLCKMLPQSGTDLRLINTIEHEETLESSGLGDQSALPAPDDDVDPTPAVTRKPRLSRTVTPEPTPEPTPAPTDAPVTEGDPRTSRMDEVAGAVSSGEVIDVMPDDDAPDHHGSDPRDADHDPDTGEVYDDDPGELPDYADGTLLDDDDDIG